MMGKMFKMFKSSKFSKVQKKAFDRFFSSKSLKTNSLRETSKKEAKKAVVPIAAQKFTYTKVDSECNVYIYTLFKHCVACVFIFSATIIYLIKLRQRGDRQLLIYVKCLKTAKLE